MKIFLAAITTVTMATPALAATFEFHGDLNNRFGLYTNQAGMYSGTENVQNSPQLGKDGAINEDDVEEFFADIKYRLNMTAATNDGAVKGVIVAEIGGIQFGNGSAGDFSGDGVAFEVRDAYTDFQLPGVQNKARVSIGLQAFTVNPFVWWEKVPAVLFKGNTGAFDYTLGWARGLEALNTSDDDDLFEDADALLARGDFKPAEGTKLGLFALYQRSSSLADSSNSDLGAGYLLKQFAEADYDLYTLGVDGGFTTPTSYGNAFVNWDVIYQGGSIDNDLKDDADVNSYLLHADLGINVGATRFTYTGWYASGDDDDADDDFENFLATDVDRFDSVIFFEGGFTDDDYFTEAPYILNKGLIFNKLAVDHNLSEKTTVGGALIYLMTAEDLTLADGSKEDKLGTEIDVTISHKLYDNLELALNGGYLFADDGMDFWEGTASADGDSDTDIYRITSRVRYKF